MLTLSYFSDPRWGKFAKCSGDGIDHDITLPATGDVTHSVGQSATMWHWTPGGNHVALASMANASSSLQDWQYAGSVNPSKAENIVWRTSGDTAKSYWTLKSDTSPIPMPDVTPGTVWAADTTYRWAWVTDADALCSRS